MTEEKMKADQQAAAEEAAEHTRMLFASACIAVTSGLAVQLGSLIQPDMFRVHGVKTAAAVFIALNELTKPMPPGFERDVYVEAFLESVRGQIAKQGLMPTMGRIIQPAADVARYTVDMLKLARDEIATAQARVDAERSAQNMSNPLQSMVQQQSAPNNTAMLLKVLGG